MRRIVFGLALLSLLALAPPASAWTWPLRGEVLRPYSLGSDAYAAGQHRGVDVAGVAGEIVRAPAAGVVSFAGVVPGSGRTVTIQLDGYWVSLTHLGEIAVVEGGRSHRGRGSRLGGRERRGRVADGVRPSRNQDGRSRRRLRRPGDPPPSASRRATSCSSAVACPRPVPSADHRRGGCRGSGCRVGPCGSSDQGGGSSPRHCHLGRDHRRPVTAWRAGRRGLGAGARRCSGGGTQRRARHPGAFGAGHRRRRPSPEPRAEHLSGRRSRYGRRGLARIHGPVRAARARARGLEVGFHRRRSERARSSAGDSSPWRPRPVGSACAFSCIHESSDGVGSRRRDVAGCVRRARSQLRHRLRTPERGCLPRGPGRPPVGPVAPCSLSPLPSPRSGRSGACWRPSVESISMERFYVTTPIYYVNSTPHIGHAYTTIAADILARHQRQRGDETFFLTGVDEHAAKVARVAAEQGLSPQEYADRIAVVWRELPERLNASNDFFIRTSDEEHKRFVQDFLQRLYDNGARLPGRLCGALLRRLRGVQDGGRSRRRQVPRARS